MSAAVTQKKYDVSYKKVFVTGGSGFVGRTLIRTLVRNGIEVIAIARSYASVKIVEECGARSVQCDLSDQQKMKDGMKDCEVVFHCAALTDFSQPWSRFVEANVEGTRHVIQAAISNKVSKVIHVSSEAALVQGFGSPLVDVDESTDLPDPMTQSHLFYSCSKNMAERVCLEYASKCDIVIVRPRLIWGVGDSVVLPKMVAQAKSVIGFPWIGGAEFLTSTVNISNVIHGMILASQHGTPGQAYFLTDDRNCTFREFFTAIFETQGVRSDGFFSIPLMGAQLLAWTGLFPDLSYATLSLLAQQVTVSCNRAKEELRYEPIVTFEEGLKELKESAVNLSEN